MSAICEAVKTASGKNIGIGTSSFHQGLQNPNFLLTIGADNEPARTVLQRALDPSHVGPTKTSWSLLYAPDLKMYALNLRQVQIEISTPLGGKVKRPVFR